MTDLRQAAQQALEALIHMCHNTFADKGYDGQLVQDAIDGLKGSLAQQEQEPVAWTDRELELIDGMIEVQLHHAAQCDGIANRAMAERQKSWDMERVALLRKIKSSPPRRETEQEPVAWQWLDTGHFRKKLPVDAESGAWNPLFTHPLRREWKSLTNEELNRIESQARSHDGLNLSFLFLEIQQALKEKNHG